MSQEAAPEQAVPEHPAPRSVPEQQGAGAPKGLLQQMEELMAALSADLNQLDADLQSTSDRLAPDPSPSDPSPSDLPAPDRAAHDKTEPHQPQP
ncbi:hypothetical protein PV371_33860 [Streptomyces sp. TX20-6-3]|uniref:hypothetical protein n=1 Tax=Streptomyces sp. TX20-6-3 TaxID=3028705 RepID=UPI0029BEF741|nr:hypothetical protein [Streptomyces sp. TX20-6-3]MDX2564613.1 hypothetical protein [Streptomyces sp. TX20-6-3]